MILDLDAAPVTVVKGEVGEKGPGRTVAEGIAAVGDGVADAAPHEQPLVGILHIENAHDLCSGG
jgi:hypothetical protein